MKLADYLRVNGITLEAFAKSIGRSAATVSRLARGRQKPDWTTMEAITAATSGAVKPNDFAERTAA